MAEIGINIAAAAPKLLTPDIVRTSDIVITMGCGDITPHVTGITYRDWKLDDPAGQPPDIVRAIRNDIAKHVHALVAEILPATNTP